jgi:hypothetical protein
MGCAAMLNEDANSASSAECHQAVQILSCSKREAEFVQIMRIER